MEQNKKFIMIKFLLLALLSISIVVPVYSNSASVYVWRNEQGTLVFSDTPRAGAEEVNIKPDNIVRTNSVIETQLLDITPQKINDAYEVAIIIPENNTTIRDNTGSIFIQSIIKPIFKRGLKIQLLLDSKVYGSPQIHGRFSLRNIDRGEHKIKVRLIDEKDKTIALSEEVTFYMHRSSTH